MKLIAEKSIENVVVEKQSVGSTRWATQIKIDFDDRIFCIALWYQSWSYQDPFLSLEYFQSRRLLKMAPSVGHRYA